MHDPLRVRYPSLCRRLAQPSLAFIVLAALIALSGVAWAGPTIKPRQPEATPTEAPSDDGAQPGEADPGPEADAGDIASADVVYVEEGPSVEGFEIGLRAQSFTAFDDWVEGDETADYGGLGILFRWRFDESWMFGLGVDIVGRSAEDRAFEDTRVLTDFAFAWYLFEPDWFQLYVPFGLIVANGSMTEDGIDLGEYNEIGAYVGFGTDFYVDDWRFNTELRVGGLSRVDDLSARSYNDYTRLAPDGQATMQLLFGVLYSL